MIGSTRGELERKREGFQFSRWGTTRKEGGLTGRSDILKREILNLGTRSKDRSSCWKSKEGKVSGS